LALLTHFSNAATLVGIVSDRNAAEVAEAAHALAAAHPRDRFVLRSVAQLDSLSEQDLRALFQSADAVLLATVFKENAQRLTPILASSRAKTALAFAGDTALGRQSRWSGSALFEANDARYDELSSFTADQDAEPAAIEAAAKKYE